MKELQGRVWKLRKDVDTDIIIATQYLVNPNIEEMKMHAFEPLRPELASQIRKGDIIVAGKNFGCGSSREQAPEVLCALGIGCIIAPSFARIFFRNAINNGLLLIENSELPEKVREGDVIRVIPGEAVLWNNMQYSIPKMPEDLLRIIEDGGLVKSIKKRNHIME